MHLPRLLGATLIAAAAFAVAPAAAATATPASAPGYIRVAHLSPDTTAADVTLTALSGGTSLYSLTGVPFGGISQYMTLQPGTYVLAMAPTENGGNVPLVNAEVVVTAGTAQTIAAVGENAEIRITTIADDLTMPAAGVARARVVNASTKYDAVSVATDDGTELVSDAAFAAVGEYVDVEPGTRTFALTADGGAAEATADLTAGASQTLFVLDDAAGGLTLLPVLDSAAVTETPVGGVAAGGGGLAAGTDATAALLAAAAGVGLLAVTAVVGLRRSQPAPSRHRA